MIELERHIEILLLNNDCVIVPELGGFMAHYAEARYDSRDCMFLPPMRMLGFNPALKMNDSLLAQSYIEAYDISYPEAIQRIEDEVNELRQHLENEGVYELNDIGTLMLNEHGHYEFTPCEAGILTPTLYGLCGMEVEPIAEILPIKAEPEEKPHEEVAKEVAIGKATDEKNEEEGRAVRIPISALRNIAAAAIVVLVFFLFSTPLHNGVRKDASMLSVNTNVLEHIMPKEMEKGNEEKLAETKTAATANQKTAETSPTEQNPVSYYTLVLASQVSKKNAEEFTKKLHAQGLKEAQVLTKKSSTRVVFNRYTTESEAYNALRQLRDKHADFSEAWVYQVKN